jgi:hypothetical protein
MIKLRRMRKILWSFMHREEDLIYNLEKQDVRVRTRFNWLKDRMK